VVIPVYDDVDTPPGIRPWVVWSLFALNVGVFLVFAVLPPQLVQKLAFNFGIVPAFIVEGVTPEGVTLMIPPVLTLVTYTFLHANWMHLAANMLFLYVLGDNVERAMGHLRFIVFYVVCGVAGGLAHVAMASASGAPLIGASGAISGVVSAYVLLRPTAHVTFLVAGILPITARAFWVIALWFAWQVANLVLPLAETNVAYWSHVAGFLTGLVLTALLRRPGVALTWFTRLR
jgi:membrane associated rhomboid family serine protease